MPLRRFSLPAAALPKPARPPLAVAFVGGMIALLISTGHAAAGEPSVDARPAAATGPASATGATVAAAGMLAPPGAVTRALDALAPAGSRSSDRASRSAHRKPLADTPPAHRWVRPNGGPLTSRFGYRWGRLHAGIDLAGPYGSAIVAATDGCITYAGPESGYGEILKMTDWDGTETWYAHMSAFERTSGCVKAGQVIARVGMAGDATGPHLHFEVHVGGAPVDPIPFLAKRGLYI